MKVLKLTVPVSGSLFLWVGVSSTLLAWVPEEGVSITMLLSRSMNNSKIILLKLLQPSGQLSFRFPKLLSPYQSPTVCTNSQKRKYPLSGLITVKKPPQPSRTISLLHQPWLPDWLWPFILDMNASDTGIGAVLSQSHPDGTEHVICYASCILTKPEQNYCMTWKELLAVVTFLQQFQQYLLHALFIIQTKGLQSWQNP